MTAAVEFLTTLTCLTCDKEMTSHTELSKDGHPVHIGECSCGERLYLCVDKFEDGKWYVAASGGK